MNMHSDVLQAIHLAALQRPACRLYVIHWRTKQGQTLTSERYSPTARAARASIRPALREIGARLLCTREHTGIGYANRGRFV